MGAGSWGLGRLASSMGMSRWLGLAFVLNPGIIFELAIDGGSLLGWALAVWGLVAVNERQMDDRCRSVRRGGSSP